MKKIKQIFIDTKKYINWINIIILIILINSALLCGEVEHSIYMYLFINFIFFPFIVYYSYITNKSIFDSNIKQKTNKEKTDKENAIKYLIEKGYMKQGETELKAESKDCIEIVSLLIDYKNKN